MLIYAIITITLALVFYTIGVWAEKLQGQLKKWHLLVFWTGFVFDTTGTILMGQIAQGGFSFNLHGISGLLAILLMFIHAVWASVVLAKNNEKQKISFHKFSIFVWLIWLIPFISGMIVGMGR